MKNKHIWLNIAAIAIGAIYLMILLSGCGTTRQATYSGNPFDQLFKPKKR